MQSIRQMISIKIDNYISQLTQEDRMLLVLKKELYDGSWETMLKDLRSRLNGKPFILKLANRIEDDITRIEKLCAFEKTHNTNLSDFVNPPNQR
jgi:hypothetical protein